LVEEAKHIEKISSSLSQNASESLVGDYLNIAQSKHSQEGFEPKTDAVSLLLSSTDVTEKAVSLAPNIVKPVENKAIQQSIQTGVILF